MCARRTEGSVLLLAVRAGRVAVRCRLYRPNERQNGQPETGLYCQICSQTQGDYKQNSRYQITAIRTELR